MTELDWAPYEVPILIRRNFTVSSPHPKPADWPVLDLAFLRAKLELGPEVQLNFTRLVLKGYRKTPVFQSPGFDILYNAGLRESATSTSAGEAPSGGNASAADSTRTMAADVVPAAAPANSTKTAASRRVGWIEHAAMIHRVCFPIEETLTSLSTAPRPVGVGGPQQALPRVTPPTDGCVNDSSRWDMRRCWPAVGLYIDLAADGFDVDSYSTHRTGYILWVTDTYFMCEIVMTKECIQKYDILGCYKAILSGTSTSGTSGGGGGGSGGGGGGGNKQRPLEIVLPSALGGVFAVALVVAAIIWAVNKRRRSRTPTATAAAASERLPKRPEISELGIEIANGNDEGGGRDGCVATGGRLERSASTTRYTAAIVSPSSNETETETETDTERRPPAAAAAAAAETGAPPAGNARNAELPSSVERLSHVREGAAAAGGFSVILRSRLRTHWGGFQERAGPVATWRAAVIASALRRLVPYARPDSLLTRSREEACDILREATRGRDLCVLFRAFLLGVAVPEPQAAEAACRHLADAAPLGIVHECHTNGLQSIGYVPAAVPWYMPVYAVTIANLDRIPPRRVDVPVRVTRVYVDFDKLP
ncbi:hypothetical protein PLESTF_000755700 [Pleodorina starrii]|nr:hypothetical protein PLESTF_000755700 [Pleodorina starrii]